MKKEAGSIPEREYVVVLRGTSALKFLPQSGIRKIVPGEFGNIQISITSRQLNLGHDNPVVGDLWVDVRGSAESLEAAVVLFSKLANSFLAYIVLAMNCASDDLGLELTYDNSPNVKEREYLQVFFPHERHFMREGRYVDIELANLFITQLLGHPESERLGRAIAQYLLALRHMRMGHEILATAHLYMGIEAITKSVIRAQLKRDVDNDEEIARRLGIDPDKLGPCDRLGGLIEAMTRKQIIFQKDEDCYKNAKAASDGFEHGFMQFDEIRERALEVRDKTAHYLRHAIIDLLEFSDEDKSKFFREAYEKPLSNWPAVSYLRGTLIGEADNLASEENEYPITHWRSKLSDVQVNDDGEVKLVYSENIQPQLAEGVELKLGSREVWAP